MADDGAKRSDGGILAPPNPLLHNEENSNPEPARISPEDCYDPHDLIFNSNLLHWETVLLGGEIKAPPLAADAVRPATLAENIPAAMPKEEKAVLPTARPEAKPPAKRTVEPASQPAAPAKRVDSAASQPTASAKRVDSAAGNPDIKAERAPDSGRAKPAAKAAAKSAQKPVFSAEVTAEIARGMAEITPSADIEAAIAAGADKTAEALRPSLDAGHSSAEKKTSGLLGRLFGGAKKAATGAAASAAVSAADTTAAEAVKAVVKASGAAVAETVSMATAPATKTASTAAKAKAEHSTGSKSGFASTATKTKAEHSTGSKSDFASTAAKAKAEHSTGSKSGFASTATAEKHTPTKQERAESVLASTAAKAKAEHSTGSKSDFASTAAKAKAEHSTGAKTVTAGSMKSTALRHAKPAKKAADRPLSASNPLYRYFYFTGIQLMRSLRKRRKRVTEVISEERRNFAESRAKRRRSVKATRHVRKMEFHAPFADLREKYKIFASDLKNARQYGSMGATLKVFTHMLGFIFKSGWHILSAVLNYAAPIAACILVALYVSRETSATMALKVEYNGVDLGYIADESVFTKAENDMKSRMILGDVYVADPTNDDESKVTYEEKQNAEQLAKTKSLVVPRYTLEPVSPGEILTADELTNSLIRAAGKSDGNPNGFAIEEADGLYIDDYYIGAVTDGQGLLDTMSGMLDEYSTDIDETDGPIRAQFVKKVQVKRGLYPTNSIRPLGEIQTLLGQEASGTKQYTVVDGDTPLRIAAKSGISFDDLKILNPDVETSLQPGDTLLIAKSAPYLGVKISKTIKYEEKVKYSIIQKIDKERAVGYSDTTQKGSEGINEITAEVVMIDGIEVERNILDTRVVKKPVDQIVLIGGTRKVTVIPSDSSGQVTSGAFAWPAPVHNIGTGFLGYAGHTGADIVWGGCYGSPIYASAGGVVVASGWGGMYGNRIIIDHGGGVQTLYGHCSELYVGVGAIVSQGQTIAAIGRTGNVTGPHLHFEIRINGTPVNPARYLY